MLLAPSAARRTRPWRAPRPPRGATVKQQPARGRLPLQRAGRGQLRRRPRLRRRGRAGRRGRRLPSRRRGREARRPPEAGPARRQLHRHLPGRLRRRPHRLQRLRLLDRQGRAGADGDGRRTGRRRAAPAPRPRSAWGSLAGVQYAALAVALGAPRLPPARLVRRRARLVGGGGERWQRPSAAFARRLRRRAARGRRCAGALSAVAAIVFEAAQAAGVSGHLGARLRRSCARSSGHPLRHRLGASPPWPGSCSRLGVVPRASPAAPGRVAPLLLPLAFIALEPALVGPPEHPVAGRRCSSRPTSSTSSRWRSGSAAWRLARPGPARRDPRAGAGAIAAACSPATLARFSPLALACVGRDPAHRPRPGLRLRPPPRQPASTPPTGARS